MCSKIGGFGEPGFSPRWPDIGPDWAEAVITTDTMFMRNPGMTLSGGSYYIPTSRHVLQKESYLFMGVEANFFYVMDKKVQKFERMSFFWPVYTL